MNDRVIAEIDLGKIRANISELRGHVGMRVEVMPVVKADAYGHGAVDVARVAQEVGAEWLGVATLEEALQIRRALPRPNIALFGPFPHSDAEDLVINHITPFVGDVETAQALSRAAQKVRSVARIHIDVDTGMGRSGVLPGDVSRLAGHIARMSSMLVTGLTTHFPSAEDDPTFTTGQLAQLLKAAEEVKATDSALTHLHSANSAALLTYPASRLNMVRPGLLVYGIVPPVPSGTPLPKLLPAMTLKTTIGQVRALPAGHTISYSRTRTLDRPSRVATLPIGYGDGYPRDLGNRGSVLIGGMRAPILGLVCMDVTMVDVTGNPAAMRGAEAVLIGEQGEDRITVEEIARLIGATEHEITTGLGNRVKKVHIDTKKPAEPIRRQ